MPKIIRLSWLIVLVLFYLLAAAMLVFSWNAIFADQAVMQIGRTVSPALSYDALARYIYGWRALLGIVFYACAGLLFAKALWVQRVPAGLGSVMLLMLLSFPITTLFGSVGALPVADSLALVVLGLSQLFSVLGLLVFQHIYPDGRFVFAWLAWLLGGLVALLGLMVVLFRTGLIPNEAVYLLLLVLATAFFSGVWAVSHRYRLAADIGVRRQLGGFLVMYRVWYVVLICWIGLSLLTELESSPWWVFIVAFHVVLPSLVLMPLSVLYALYAGQLWGARLSRRTLKIIGAAWLALFLLNLAWPGIVALQTYPPASQVTLPALAAGQPRPVIIDTDMGGDDWMAILALLKRPEIDVQAITVSGTGLTHCHRGVPNVLKLVKLAGHESMPVACGRGAPLEGLRYFPRDWRTASDNLPGGDEMIEAANLAGEQDAAALITTALRRSPEKVTVLALGPLTNLAQALQADPGLKDRIEMLFIMGGAVDAPGNVGYFGDFEPNGLAEWNIYIDPLAAQIVIESGVPITLVALDATNQVPVTLEMLISLPAEPSAPEARFVNLVLYNNQPSVEAGEYFLWDPLAAALLIDETLATYETRTIQVITGEGPRSGQTRTVKNGIPVRLPVRVDVASFEALFFDVLGFQ